ncbi:MAG TPA: insulinase family protein, partial [Bacteroidales bacterium]|nr:insulinase family protein [Bacteroidales bacterium]
MPAVSPVCYCALTTLAGTRFEPESLSGLAHFCEHMLFKGTIKRKSYHINNRLERLGGEINAFTTKEELVLHATVLREDIGKALELISDLVF